MKRQALFILGSIILFPAICFALTGKGTATEPYLIQSLADFDEFADSANYRTYWASGVHTLLQVDIDFDGRPSFATAVIAPDTDSSTYGHQGERFSGVFDGGNHKIKNLTINTGDTDNDYLGLFGKLDFYAEIKNLGIENIAITASTDSDTVGGLCGEKLGSYASNCYVTGSVSGGDNTRSIGGLCGLNYFGVLINCYATADVSVTDGGEGSQLGSAFVGGLCGSNSDAIIVNCYASGDVTGRDSTVILGGLIGSNTGTVINSYSNGAVSGGYIIGGLCGQNTSGSINNCYTASSVSAAIISDVGGLCGKGDSLSITNSFWDASIGGPDNGLGTPKTTLQMQTQSTFAGAGWDFVGETANGLNEIWQMSAGEYPQLSSLSGYAPVALPGSGTSGDPYLVNTPSQLGAIYHHNSDAHYQLTGNIDLSGIKWSASPIPVFGGVFDGGGHVISNLEITGVGYTGMIGYLSDGTITGIGLEDVDITPIANSTYVGSLCGNNWNGAISKCYATGNITGQGSVTNVGGLVGGNANVYSPNYKKIELCYADVNVQAGDMAGGLCGSTNGTAITDCYATGNVTGSDSVGGIVGYADDGPHITNCYATGTITGTGVYVGGICGYRKFAGLINCFEMNGPYSVPGNSKTDAEMKDKDTFLAGFWRFSDFETGVPGSWYIANGEYPKLFWQVPGVSYVPDVRGETLTNAQSSLTAAGFSVGGVHYVPSLSVPANQVTGLSVCMNGLMYSGNDIDIYVSTGNNGDGSEAAPYPVACQSDIEYMSSHTEIHDQSFVMTADVYFEAGTVYERALIAPDLVTNKYDYQGTAFTGNFNGDQHKIINLTINSTDRSYDFLGLFGMTGADAEISELALEGVYLLGGSNSDHVGAICAVNHGSITDSHVTGGISSRLVGLDYLGMICGVNSGQIDNSYAKGYCYGDEVVGGLCGNNSYGSSITNCYSRVTVYGSNATGGLCGGNNGSISESYAHGLVGGYEFTGGLCGTNYGPISDSYARGSVKGYTFSGGFCGYNYGPIDNCYSASTIDSRGSNAGAFCGFSAAGKVTASFCDKELYVYSYGSGTPKTTEEMQTLSAFLSVGWDFSEFDGDPEIWQLPVDDYPRLAWEIGVIRATAYVPDVVAMTEPDSESALITAGLNIGTVTQVYNQYVDAGNVISQSPVKNTLVMLDTAVDVSVSLGSAMTGQGTESDPYVISRVEALEEFADRNNQAKYWADGVYTSLQADLDLSGISIAPIGYGVLISDTNDLYSGVFYGNGHTISNLTYSVDDGSNVGLFGRVGGSNSVIRNLTLLNANIDAPRSSYVGLLVGLFSEGQLKNCYVEGGSVKGANNTGGLAGWVDGNSTIDHCYSTADVDGNGQVGGLVGHNIGAKISRCFATGNVKGSSAGGLVGMNWAQISSSYATGNVTGYSEIGGLVGINPGEIVNCYAQGQVGLPGEGQNAGGLVGRNGRTWSGGGSAHGQIAFSYSTGSVEGISEVGGLVGLNDPGDIISSFWDTQTSGQANSAGGTGALTSDMQNQDIFTNDGWNFTKPVWMISGTDYPRLIWSDPDINNNSRVDMGDLAALSALWMTSDCGFCDDSDLTGDRIVDAKDLSVLAENWLYEDRVADHILQIEMTNHWIYDDPDDASSVQYGFEFMMIVDDRVAAVKFLTPTGTVIDIPATFVYTELPGKVVESDWNLDEGASADAGEDMYEWYFYAIFEKMSDLGDFGDGLYTITVEYVGGHSHQTDVWFGIPGTNDPMPQPTQIPLPLYPAPGESVTSPVTFSWEECTDANANFIWSGAENDATDDEIEEMLPKGSTTWGPWDLSEGLWQKGLVYGTFHQVQNSDGIDLFIFKYSLFEYEFTVVP